MHSGMFLGTRLHVSYTLGRQVTHVSGPTEVQVLLDIRSSAQYPDAPCLDLRLVIDRSSSMDWKSCPDHDLSKLDVVKLAINELITELEPTDYLTIVSFDQSARLDLPRTPMDVRGVELARRAIERLTPNGCTFISDALREALNYNCIQGISTKVILFTDGDSTQDPSRDHAALVSLADHARAMKLPLLIYGTGVDYNWSLLKQLSIRAGNGSSTKHVMEMDELREHLRGELAYMRGTAVEGLEIIGLSKDGVQLSRVTRFMPDLHQLSSDSETWQHPYDFMKPGLFKDQSGSLDVSRGQQYLITLVVDGNVVGEHPLIELTLQGKATKLHAPSEPFSESFVIDGVFTEHAHEASEVNTVVENVLLMIVAARHAQEQKYDKAEELYRKAGDYTTATTMGRLREFQEQGLRHQVDVARTGATLSSRAVSMIFTQAPKEPKE